MLKKVHITSPQCLQSELITSQTEKDTCLSLPFGDLLEAAVYKPWWFRYFYVLGFVGGFQFSSRILDNSLRKYAENNAPNTDVLPRVPTTNYE
jgi:hypothetical protein